MPMKNPPHPGSVVLSECIEPLGLTITQAALALGVTRTTLSELVNGRRGISPEMAIRLSQVFGGSAESWITQQAQYELAQIPAGRIQLKRLAVACTTCGGADGFCGAAEAFDRAAGRGGGAGPDGVQG
jgi:addiction module HigA family antidote